MKMLPVLVLALVLPVAAHAQLYKWIDQDGKTRYGDTPPPGVKATTMRGVPAASQSAPAPAGADAKKKGPLTPAEQDKEFRKRQDEARKAGDKAAQESQVKAQRNEGCERTKEYLRTLESGQRIARTNPSGERYYMSEEQVAQETAKARESAQQACK